jgi:hypothetical protein
MARIEKLSPKWAAPPQRGGAAHFGDHFFNPRCPRPHGNIGANVATAAKQNQ